MAIWISSWTSFVVKSMVADPSFSGCDDADIDRIRLDSTQKSND